MGGLSLAYNCVGDSGALLVALGLARAPAGHGLAPLRHVRRLHLDGNVVGDAGAAALADLLSLPGCLLEALTLSDNQVGRRGVRALATALGVNSSLRLLDLSHNLLAPEDAAQVLPSERESERETTGYEPDAEPEGSGVQEGSVTCCVERRCARFSTGTRRSSSSSPG